MVDRITLAMRRMSEALRHSTEEHDASVLTNGVEALDSKRAAEPPSRRAAEPPSRRAAEPPHLRLGFGHERAGMAVPSQMGVFPD